ncbi:hypothetical protein KCU99_g10139, partial [Aureobasidium melanogenum]
MDNADLERSDTGDTKKKRRPKISIVSQFNATLLNFRVNVLLVCVPVGFALRYTHANGYVVFVVNFLAIIPLVAILSLATEELALCTGEIFGGLLNASFGNATELRVRVRHFNITVTQTASSMLAVSIGSLIIPTAFQRFGNNPASGVAPISRGTAIILLLIYFAYLIFQLKTHVEIYNTPGQTPKKKKGSTLMGIARIGAGTAASAGGQVN